MVLAQDLWVRFLCLVWRIEGESRQHEADRFGNRVTGHGNLRLRMEALLGLRFSAAAWHAAPLACYGLDGIMLVQPINRM
jgi:hypothetical protein